jgi:hypothetical protein
MKTDKISKSAWIGITEDNLLIKAIILFNGHNEVKYWYANTLSYRDILTEDEGRDRAEEFLADGELWKSAVAIGQTEQSMTEWNEMIIDNEGFELILDLTPFVDYFLEGDTIGGREEYRKAKYKVLFVSESDKTKFLNWNPEAKEGTKQETAFLNLFDKYKDQDEKIISEKFRAIIRGDE